MTPAAARARSRHDDVAVALVGRQNAGKTSLSMQLTGHIQKPVNFPGSSVERGESTVHVGDTTLRVVDLPGVASLDAVSPDEAVTLDYLRATGADRPDVALVVIDASKLAVELQLVAHVCSLGLPVVIALNKLDVAADEGLLVDVEALSEALTLPIYTTNALAGTGTEALRRALVTAARAPAQAPVSVDPRALASRVVTANQTTTGRTLTDRLDAVLLHRIFGLPVLLIVLFGVFQALFTLAVPFMDVIEAGQAALSDAVSGAVDPGALQSFLNDGVINGVGSTVIFLPQIALLMLIVALLEGTGYMARAAFLLDRPLSRVGLSGRSFVPMVSSFACAVPGILASRIIPNERDRIATIVVAPLMSCSARLPVYVLLIGAFLPASYGGVALLSLYLLGIVVAAGVALLLRRTVLRGGTSALMMELPVYQRPSWPVVRAQVWAGCRDFLVLAGTVIFAAAVVIWLLSYYPRPAEVHDGFEARRATAAETLTGEALDARVASLDAGEQAAYLEQSYLAEMGRAVHPVFAPAGWDWRTTVGVVAAFPARELIIPTLGILHGQGDVDPGQYEVGSMGGADVGGRGDGLRERLKTSRDADGNPAFSPLIAVALMVFLALCSQCVGTLAAIKRETRSWRWPLFTFGYMTALAWLFAVLVFQVGSALGLA